MMDTLSDTYITTVYDYHSIPLNRKLSNHNIVSEMYHGLRMTHTDATFAAHGPTSVMCGMSFTRMSSIGRLSMLQIA
jgi:hypothetical protein